MHRAKSDEAYVELTCRGCHRRWHRYCLATLTLRGMFSCSSHATPPCLLDYTFFANYIQMLSVSSSRCASPSLVAWSHHTDGLSALISLRGNFQCKTARGRAIIWAALEHIVSNFIVLLISSFSFLLDLSAFQSPRTDYRCMFPVPPLLRRLSRRELPCGALFPHATVCLYCLMTITMIYFFSASLPSVSKKLNL